MQTHPLALKQDGSRADAGLLTERTARSLKQLGDYDEKEETHGKRKSNRVLPGAKKKLKVADNLTSEMHFVLQTRWLAATTVGDDVLNYIAIEFVIRRWNYSPLDMMRCLYGCRCCRGNNVQGNCL